MKNNARIAMLFLLIVLNGCDEQSVKGPGSKEVLVSQGFVDDNSYRIICRGFPLEGLEGLQRAESSKRAALLSAYYFIGQVFNESVAPDRDGKTEKIEYAADHAVLHYMIRKKGLKKMVRTGPKTDADTGIRPEREAGTGSEPVDAVPGTATETR